MHCNVLVVAYLNLISATFQKDSASTIKLLLVKTIKLLLVKTSTFSNSTISQEKY